MKLSAIACLLTCISLFPVALSWAEDPKNHEFDAVRNEEQVSAYHASQLYRLLGKKGASMFPVEEGRDKKLKAQSPRNAPNPKFQ